MKGELVGGGDVALRRFHSMSISGVTRKCSGHPSRMSTSILEPTSRTKHHCQVVGVPAYLRSPLMELEPPGLTVDCSMPRRRWFECTMRLHAFTGRLSNDSLHIRRSSTSILTRVSCSSDAPCGSYDLHGEGPHSASKARRA